MITNDLTPNEELCIKFFDGVHRGDKEHLSKLFAEDAVAEFQQSLPMPRLTGRDVIAEVFSISAGSVLAPGWTYEVGDMASKGDVVFATLKVQATVAIEGTRYNQFYIFLFRFRDGEIVYISENTDTKYALDTLGKAMQEWEPPEWIPT